MKKITLAAVIGAAALASVNVQADTTLYGSVIAEIDYTDLRNPGMTTLQPLGDTYLRRGPNNQTQDSWGVWDGGTHFGIKGSEAITGDVKGIYNLEVGLDITDGTIDTGKEMWVGLQSDSFGTLSFGKQYSPYYNVVGLNDQFNGAASGLFFVTGDPSEGSRFSNSIYYATPSMGGFALDAMAVMDGDDQGANAPFSTGKKGLDLWNVAGHYKNGPIYAGASFIRSQETKDWGIGSALGYTGKRAGLSFTYEYYKPKNNMLATIKDGGETISFAVRRKGHSASVLGSVAFGEHTLRALYAQNLISSDADNRFIQLGYQFNLSKRTYLWAEGYRNNIKTAWLGTVNPEGKYYNVSLGVSHDF